MRIALIGGDSTKLAKMSSIITRQWDNINVMTFESTDAFIHQIQDARQLILDRIIIFDNNTDQTTRMKVSLRRFSDFLDKSDFSCVLRVIVCRYKQLAAMYYNTFYDDDSIIIVLGSAIKQNDFKALSGEGKLELRTLYRNNLYMGTSTITFNSVEEITDSKSNKQGFNLFNKKQKVDNISVSNTVQDEQFDNSEFSNNMDSIFTDSITEDQNNMGILQQNFNDYQMQSPISYDYNNDYQTEGVQSQYDNSYYNEQNVDYNMQQSSNNIGYDYNSLDYDYDMQQSSNNAGYDYNTTQNSNDSFYAQEEETYGNLNISNMDQIFGGTGGVGSKTVPSDNVGFADSDSPDDFNADSDVEDEDSEDIIEDDIVDIKQQGYKNKEVENRSLFEEDTGSYEDFVDNLGDIDVSFFKD